MCVPLPRARALLAALVLAKALLAHGGQYRGPGNVVPPTPSGVSARSSPSGNTSGSGNAGPKDTTSKGAVTPGATPLAGGTAPGGRSGGGPTVGGGVRGAPVDDDLGRWEFWWEFGKDPYLRLRDAVQAATRSVEDDVLPSRRFAFPRRVTVPPTGDDLDRVRDALAASLRSASDRDTVSGCLVALAKIGRDQATATLPELFAPFLRVGDQELRETAALALGIAGQVRPEPIAWLLALLRDDAEGRRLSGDVPVNERTRAFAAYGCGLLLARCGDKPDQAALLADGLLAIVRSPGAHGRDLLVAAIEALALVPHDAGARGQMLRERVAAGLGEYYLADLGPGERLMQAHVPPAIARLIPAPAAASVYWQRVFAADLAVGTRARWRGDGTERGDNLFVAQSCALALGSLAAPWNADTDRDADTAQLLLRAYHDHRDQQTRAFALLALARLGGGRARAVLLQELERGSRALEQPWCAVALGVLHARTVEQAARAGRSVDGDPALQEALAAAFERARNPSAIGAIAIALGLAGSEPAGDRMRAALADHRQRDDVAGYLALGLGLMRDERAAGPIRDVLAGASHRPFLMMQCARALGLLGDHGVAELLCRELEQPDGTLARLAALAAAVGQIGDRGSLDPLLRMLANEQLTPLTRAFAAVALGSICDKDPLPWNHAFATFTNYRASTATLTDGASGILDIL